MTTKSISQQARSRQIHRVLAPVMVLPIILTLITGVLYQIADMSGQDEQFDWLLNLHKGNFMVLNLEGIYVFLNGLGLLFLAIIGTVMWKQQRRQPTRHESRPEVGSGRR